MLGWMPNTGWQSILRTFLRAAWCLMRQGVKLFPTAALQREMSPVFVWGEIRTGEWEMAIPIYYRVKRECWELSQYCLIHLLGITCVFRQMFLHLPCTNHCGTRGFSTTVIRLCVCNSLLYAVFFTGNHYLLIVWTKKPVLSSLCYMQVLEAINWYFGR